MPTYQYVCEKCGHEFEAIQSMKDSALSVCPRGLCGRKAWGKGKVKRVIGAGAGLIFKGSGFYITDYRSEGYKEAAKKESANATSSTSSESKTPAAAPKESKAPAAAESKPKPNDNK